MKAFEKWNIEHPVDSRYRDTPINQFKAFIEEGREIVWRAALEWVLINCNTNLDEWDRPTGFLEIDDDVIKDELGDK